MKPSLEEEHERLCNVPPATFITEAIIEIFYSTSRMVVTGYIYMLCFGGRWQEDGVQGQPQPSASGAQFEERDRDPVTPALGRQRQVELSLRPAKAAE